MLGSLFGLLDTHVEQVEPHVEFGVKLGPKSTVVSCPNPPTMSPFGHFLPRVFPKGKFRALNHVETFSPIVFVSNSRSLRLWSAELDHRHTLPILPETENTKRLFQNAKQKLLRTRVKTMFREQHQTFAGQFAFPHHTFVPSRLPLCSLLFLYVFVLLSFSRRPPRLLLRRGGRSDSRLNSKTKTNPPI